MTTIEFPNPGGADNAIASPEPTWHKVSLHPV